jgi:hypothetical protein
MSCGPNSCGGLNLSIADLPSHGSAPQAAERKRATLRNGGLPLQMQALSVVWLFAGLRSCEIVRLRGRARTQPSYPPRPRPPHTGCSMCGSKTGTAMTKPIDPIVGEATRLGSGAPQPPCHDPKTESVNSCSRISVRCPRST